MHSTRWRGLDHLNQQLYVSTHETILPTLLRNYDRYSMANGVEIRMLWTIAFCLLRFPCRGHPRYGMVFPKRLFVMLWHLIPAEIAYRKTKIGFSSPMVDWMKGPLKGFMLDTINSQSFRECSLIDGAQIARLVQGIIKNPDARFSDGERYGLCLCHIGGRSQSSGTTTNWKHEKNYSNSEPYSHTDCFYKKPFSSIKAKEIAESAIASTH